MYDILVFHILLSISVVMSKKFQRLYYSLNFIILLMHHICKFNTNTYPETTDTNFKFSTSEDYIVHFIIDKIIGA